jgi:predicted enzyme related to lactoylglutathione lyase
LFDAGIPCTQFQVKNIEDEFNRLSKKGVDFKVKPTDIGTAKFAVFNDTCGNFIQIVELLK